MKKIIIGLLTLVFVFSIATPARAQTSTIADLLALLEQLQKQLIALQNSSTNTQSSLTGSASCKNVSVVKDLTVGSRDSWNDTSVSDLQLFLQSKGFLSEEPTGYFGLLTQKAVAQYQTTIGISPASGFVGSITRARINAECIKTNISSDKGDTPIAKDLLFSYKSFEYEYIIGDGIEYGLSDQLLLSNESDTNVTIKVKVPNQPSWLNTNYTKDELTIYKGENMGFGISVNPTGLKAGTYKTYLVFEGNFAESPKKIPVNLKVSDPKLQSLIKPVVTYEDFVDMEGFKKLDIFLSGGTRSNPVYNWVVHMKCSAGIKEIDAKVGTSCGEDYTFGMRNDTKGDAVMNLYVYLNSARKDVERLDYIVKALDENNREMGSTSGVIKVDTSSQDPNSSFIEVITPKKGSVYDNGPTQNIIVSWEDYKGDFDYYRIFLNNSVANVGGMLPYKIDKRSNGSSFTSNEARELIEKISGKVAPDMGYQINVHAIKLDRAGEGSVAQGSSGVFEIKKDTSSNTPSISYVQAKASGKNEIFSAEEPTLYGKNFTKQTQVYVLVNGNKKYFDGGIVGNGSMTFVTPAIGVIPNGSYQLYAENGNTISNSVTITYTNQTVATPTIASLSDSSADVGSQVTIYGRNFKKDMVVVIVGNAVTNPADISVKPIKVDSQGTEMIFVVPSLSVGVYSIQVATYGGSSSNYVSLGVKSDSVTPPTKDNPVITTHSLSFNGNGATSGNVAKQTCTTSTKNASCTVKIPTNNFARTGYTFGGWATSPTGFHEYNSGDQYTTLKGNVTLYAVWKAQTQTYPRTLSFNAGGGTGTMNSITCKATTSNGSCTVKVPANAFTRKEYKFVNWTLNPGNTSGYQSGQEISIGTNYSLTANWVSTQTSQAQTTSLVVSKSVYLVSVDLEFGQTDSSVITLQKYLNSNGYVVESVIGQPGSIGFESDYFGNKTKQALIKFQQDKGIFPAQGYFGAKTRSMMGM